MPSSSRLDSFAIKNSICMVLFGCLHRLSYEVKDDF